jgi:beta-xylosidase
MKTFLASLALMCASTLSNQAASLRLPDMPLHDAFILAHEPTRTYYLYNSNRRSLSGVPGVGTMVYTSKDLLNWEKPKAVFIVPETAFAREGGWAPEVHAYQGRYYLFTTVHDREKVLSEPPASTFRTHVRGTIAAVADSPEGPFTMLDESGPVPPAHFMTLDGTLYVDRSGQPWMVYAHEWVQKVDGTMEAVPLKPDLSGAAGRPIHLFKASDAPWINASMEPSARSIEYVTDGPQLYRTRDDHLLMLWASYDNGEYAQTHARSKSGEIHGPWEQLDPLVKGDSGHGMLFHTFEGQLMMALHRPFGRNSRAKLYEMADRGDRLEVVRQRVDLDGRVAPRPLYRDPVFDAPTDPVLCFNAEENKWFMYYTARRGNLPPEAAPSVTWIHGTRIGVAESSDHGATWTYRGTAELDYGPGVDPESRTYWAPEVIWAEGSYHMFLSYVPGVFTDWNHPREIIHLTSKDGLKWEPLGPVDLQSPRVIDACVVGLPGGIWRMWYKDETLPKALAYADSADLRTWEPKGNAVTDFNGEGPKVFRWKGHYWLVADCWSNGMRVWRSPDATQWTLQEEALFGHHGDVVVSGDRAWWFYFDGPNRPEGNGRTTAINVVELHVEDGKLLPRDPAQPTYIDLSLRRESER